MVFVYLSAVLSFLCLVGTILSLVENEAVPATTLMCFFLISLWGFKENLTVYVNEKKGS